MRKGWAVGAVVRLIFIVLVVVLSFLLVFDPIWEAYGSNNCIIYQSEVISNLKSSIETAKETHGIISRGFDVAQCVECMWYNKHDGTLMVKYAVKSGLISPVSHQIVPYNISTQFVNLGCNCNDCNDPSGCSNINEKKLYHFFVNETSVECTNCDDSTNPCGAATVYSSCVSNNDCYRGYLCQSTDSSWDGSKCYSMDTIGNWIKFTDGKHWSSWACVKDYGTGCSNETECSIYSGNNINIHLGCQKTSLSSEKTCCLPLICKSYAGNNGNCNDESPSSSLSCNSNEDCNKVCGNTACGYVYDFDNPFFNEYFNCFLLPGESCKYAWQCGSSNRAIKSATQCAIPYKNNCEKTAGCEWCGCMRCTEWREGVEHCSCDPSFVRKTDCDAQPDTMYRWYNWVGCEGDLTAIGIPTTCSSGKCCINSGHSCRVADRDFCDKKYCCSSNDIIQDDKCCIPNGKTCGENWQCCSGVCSSGKCIVDVIPPTYDSDTDDHPTPVHAKTLVNVSVHWSDNGFLKTGIFKHNESGVWNSDEHPFTRNPEWFDVSIMIGYVKGKVCWYQEALDMYNNLNDAMGKEENMHCFVVT